MWMNETLIPLNHRLSSIEDKQILCIVNIELRVHLIVTLLAEIFFLYIYLITFICFSPISSLVSFSSRHYRRELIIDISRRKILISNSFTKKRNNINIRLYVFCLYLYTVRLVKY